MVHVYQKVSTTAGLMLKKALESVTHQASGGQDEENKQALESHFVDAELSLEAAADAVVEGDLHGVVDVAHLVSAHLVLDVQAHHWRTRAQDKTRQIRREKERRKKKKKKLHIFSRTALNTRDL